MLIDGKRSGPPSDSRLQNRPRDRIPRSMALIDLLLPPETWAATLPAAQALIVTLQARVRDLEARLGQTSANSSRPPSSHPPQAPLRPKAPPSGRQRGGQPGHPGACRALLPAEQVDEVVRVAAVSLCWRGENPSPTPGNDRRAEPRAPRSLAGRYPADHEPAVTLCRPCSIILGRANGSLNSPATSFMARNDGSNQAGVPCG
jgi:hypothetical protein